MFWKKKPRDYLEDLSELLDGVGIKKNSQKRSPDDSDILEAYLVARTGRRYLIYFFIDGTELVYESVVRKAVTGNNYQNVAMFYQTLFAQNSTNSLINFSIVSGEAEWLLLLKGGIEYKNVDPTFVISLISYYDLAYSAQVPRIEQLATELGLEFSGKLDKAILEFVEGINEQ